MWKTLKHADDQLLDSVNYYQRKIDLLIMDSTVITAFLKILPLLFFIFKLKFHTKKALQYSHKLVEELCNCERSEDRGKEEATVFEHLLFFLGGLKQIDKRLQSGNERIKQLKVPRFISVLHENILIDLEDCIEDVEIGTDKEIRELVNRLS